MLDFDKFQNLARKLTRADLEDELLQEQGVEEDLFTYGEDHVPWIVVADGAAMLFWEHPLRKIDCGGYSSELFSADDNSSVVHGDKTAILAHLFVYYVEELAGE